MGGADEDSGGDPDLSRAPAALAGHRRAQAPLPIAPLDHAQRVACLRLIRSENVGPVSFRALVNHFGGARPALEAVPELLRRASGRRNVRVCPVDRAEAELAAAAAAGAVPLFTIEPGYPPWLARTEVPPPLIYVRGRTDLLARTAAAVVGSRDASAGGLTLAHRLSSGLSAAGLVVVSGLARGIDATTHRAALAGGTIAVVAGGIDVTYPPEHGELQAEIGSTGAVVSEMPPGFKPRGKDFPRRNRIIAALSAAVVVVEAARRSGTLITARYAAEFGREVCAIPGHPLDPRAEGTNQLIRDGATLVTSAADVLEAIGKGLSLDTDLLNRNLAASSQPLDRDHLSEADEANTPLEIDAALAGRLLRLLGPAPVSVDDLARVADAGVRAVRIALLELSLAGQIDMQGANLVTLRPTAFRGPGMASS